MISAMIKEKRELQQQIDKLSKQTLGAVPGTVERPAVAQPPDSRQPGRRHADWSKAVSHLLRAE
jgi:hypothetical protein